MARAFRLQRFAAFAFVAAAALMLLNSLYFMTEYKDLFGLELAKNRPVAQFHDEMMQGFNKLLLWFALGGLAVAAASFLLEVTWAVPDGFALGTMSALLAAVGGCSLYVLWRVPQLVSAYLSLDFQYLKLEGAVDYRVRTTAFAVCFALHAFNASLCLAYWASLRLSRRAFVRETAGRDKP